MGRLFLEDLVDDEVEELDFNFTFAKSFPVDWDGWTEEELAGERNTARAQGLKNKQAGRNRKNAGGSND